MLHNVDGEDKSDIKRWYYYCLKIENMSRNNDIYKKKMNVNMIQKVKLIMNTLYGQRLHQSNHLKEVFG